MKDYEEMTKEQLMLELNDRKVEFLTSTHAELVKLLRAEDAKEQMRADASERWQKEKNKLNEESAQPDEKRRQAKLPTEPSAEERKQHEDCHIPFRSWCKHCVAGKKRDRDHPQSKRDTTTQNGNSAILNSSSPTAPSDKP